MNHISPVGSQVNPMNKVLWWALSTALTLAALSGCTEESAPEVAGVPATQICASTLDSSAAAALKRVSGTDEFTELEGESPGDGASNQFSLSGAVEGIHGTASERTQCTIYKADDKSGHPLIEIDFEAAASHPGSRSALKANSPKTTVYSIGAYAATNANFGATLFFACSTKGPDGGKPYVKASMYSSGDQFAEEDTGRDRMIILNSLSRRLAEKLGCAKEASLPTEVPAPMSQ
ncbi:hypothetical protein [Streptomyces sp. NBC_01092]|uniref:hypothetical protein n=1 Tax=Streptomyces sp. NBC_01092 TaxID=2903748 RepID=UPI00386C91CE|nr:hypothetical protein OG254_31200 [Streptomyces sp. NBC_01092]